VNTDFKKLEGTLVRVTWLSHVGMNHMKTSTLKLCPFSGDLYTKVFTVNVS